MGGKRNGVHPINRSLQRLYGRRDETSRKGGNQWDKQNQHVKTPKRSDAPYIVPYTQEGRVRVRMLPSTVAQKNGNDFQIIFAHHIFFSSNTGLLPGAPHISSPQVSVTAYSNVSLKCEEGVRPSDCYDNSLQWYFNNSSGELKSGEKYDIVQQRKTNTKCKTDFILTIVNVTEADEGEYKCQWLCDNEDPSFYRSSIIQLKVFHPSEGTDTSVISKGLVSRNLSKFKKWKTPPNWVKHKNNLSNPPGRGRGVVTLGKFLLGMCGNIQFTYFYGDCFLKCP